MKKILKNSLIALSITSLCFAYFLPVQAQEGEEDQAKEFIQDFSEKAKSDLPSLVKGFWKDEVLPIWSKMAEKGKQVWQETVWPWLCKVFERDIKPSIEDEIEKRKPALEEELEKEKEEIKKDLPSLWQRLKDIIKTAI
jgi:hypothetical protein